MLLLEDLLRLEDPGVIDCCAVLHLCGQIIPKGGLAFHDLADGPRYRLLVSLKVGILPGRAGGAGVETLHHTACLVCALIEDEDCGVVRDGVHYEDWPVDIHEIVLREKAFVELVLGHAHVANWMESPNHVVQ